MKIKKMKAGIVIRFSKSILSVLIMGSVSSLAIAGVTENTAALNNSLTWLEQQQNQDGSWGQDLALRYSVTTTVADSLKSSNKYTSSYYSALAWVENHGADNVDDLSRKIEVLFDHGNNIQPDLTQLNDSKQGVLQAGWGLSRAYNSSAIDSVLALNAMIKAGDAAGQASAISYLLSAQLADGGWSVVNAAVSDYWITAKVVSGLSDINTPSSAVIAALNTALTYLETAPVSSNSLVLASVTQAVFKQKGLSALVDSNITTLLTRQTPAGDWGDIYTTATVNRLLATVLGLDAGNLSNRVSINDQNLRRIINLALGKNPYDAITEGEMLLLTELDLIGSGVTDLTGLEYALNLQTLSIDTGIDTTVLAGLTNLVIIYPQTPQTPITALVFADPNLKTCVDNTATNVGAVFAEDLVSLTCAYSQISDLSGIEVLTGLKTLVLIGNDITDVTPLAGLVNLQSLYLPQNKISDVSPLGNLTNLTFLDLYYNVTISDVSALANLTKLTWLNLSNNSIVDVSALGNLTSLTLLTLANNTISDVTALGGLTSLTTLYLANNNISDVTALSNMINLSKLTLGNNSIVNITALGSLVALTELYLDSNNISDVTALGSLSNLKTLFLRFNNVSDITALGNLISLERLYFQFNTISDVTALGTLTNLNILDLQNNNVIDVTALGNLSKLKYLYLQNNNINNIATFGNLTSLIHLYLQNNSVSDVSSLTGLSQLYYLYLDNNNISDITALGSLTSLNKLSLKYNNISNLTGLTGFPQLSSLYLNNNTISDVSALSTISSLRYLDLTSNSIGGAGVGNIGTLSALPNPLKITLYSNLQMSCAELDGLIASFAYGIVVPYAATDGVYCTAP